MIKRKIIVSTNVMIFRKFKGPAKAEAVKGALA